MYVIDAADQEGLEQAKQEFHELLAKPSLASIPVLLLGNKNDLPGALSVEDLIDRLDLKVGTKADSTCFSAQTQCDWYASWDYYQYFLWAQQLVDCLSCMVHSSDVSDAWCRA